MMFARKIFSAEFGRQLSPLPPPPATAMNIQYNCIKNYYMKTKPVTHNMQHSSLAS